jgi:UDP-glucose 4-epimerase
MRDKHILVFGAAGFMGTYLIDELSKLGYVVTATDISSAGEEFYNARNIKYVQVDITHYEEFSKLEKIKYDCVLHLAAHQPANVSKESYDPADYINVNVLGTLNILKFCQETGAGKIIYASSHRNTQGLWVDDDPIKETDGRSIKFDTEYTMFSISESAAQDCVEYYMHQHDLTGIIFRLPPVYGYGPHTEIYKDGKPIKTGFQIFIEKAIACEPLEVWGDANKGRDIIYVKDVIDAYIMAIENTSAKGLYNITSGTRLTLMEEAQIIAKVFWGNDEKPIITQRPEKENGIDNFCYDISKAKQELNWEPKYSFEEMLYDYIKEGDSQKYSYLVNKRKDMFDNH